MAVAGARLKGDSRSVGDRRCDEDGLWPLDDASGCCPVEILKDGRRSPEEALEEGLCWEEEEWTFGDVPILRVGDPFLGEEPFEAESFGDVAAAAPLWPFAKAAPLWPYA